MEAIAIALVILALVTGLCVWLFSRFPEYYQMAQVPLVVFLTTGGGLLVLGYELGFKDADSGSQPAQVGWIGTHGTVVLAGAVVASLVVVLLPTVVSGTAHRESGGRGE